MILDEEPMRQVLSTTVINDRNKKERVSNGDPGLGWLIFWTFLRFEVSSFSGFSLRSNVCSIATGSWASGVMWQVEQVFDPREGGLGNGRDNGGALESTRRFQACQPSVSPITLDRRSGVV